jgi:hypothetical protein
MMLTTTSLAEPGTTDNQIVRAQPCDTTTLPQPLPRVVGRRWVIGKQGLQMQWSRHEA